ncbi:MAG: glycosyltransferase [Desulfobacteraceae bacterium]|nr:MAG: glycosyltransferase [Desulfobacteraceae bacterium]
MKRVTNMPEKKSISACMIVRNEEKYLPSCLRSIRHYVDELIIVDTGSTDNTISIAESFGARVYHHPWENHFSKHRNQSFSYAIGEWIFYIDADEELLPGSGEALLEAVRAEEDVDAVAVVLECIFDRGQSRAYNNAIRLFRNHRGLHYKGRVHNYIVGVKKSICAPIRLFHHGYNLDKKASHVKFQRTTGLLKLDIQEDPQNPRAHHFLSASYLSENMFQEAAKEASEAIRLYEKSHSPSPNYLWSLYIASSANFSSGNVGEAEFYARKALAVFPNHMDSHYMLSLVAYGKKNKAMFEQHMRGYLRAKDAFEKNPVSFGETVNNTFGSEWILFLFRGFFLMDEGKEQEAEEPLKTASSLCLDQYFFHFKLGEFFRLKRQWKEAERELRQALQIKQDEAPALYALSTVYEEQGRIADQKELLEKLLHIDPHFKNAGFSLGLAHMELGDFERSLSLFHDILAREPGHQRARINEALCLRGMGRYQEALERSLGIEAKDKDELLTLVSNVAYCYEALGQAESAVEWFQQMTEIAPEDPAPPVHLSKLYLDMNRIEPCVLQCDRLLSLLDLEHDFVLNSVQDLGGLFQTAGTRLRLRERPDLEELSYRVAETLRNFTSSDTRGTALNS